MQDPTKWDIVEARTLEFGSNVKELWMGANSDQKAFLVAMSVFVFFFFLVSALWVRWRIINRVEIRKVKHFAAMRSVLTERVDE
jgi:hypothetical protein